MRHRTLKEILEEYEAASKRSEARDHLFATAVGFGCVFVIIGIAVLFGWALLL